MKSSLFFLVFCILLAGSCPSLPLSYTPWSTFAPSTAGSDVNIPAGTTVVINQRPTISYGKIIVAGTLFLSDVSFELNVTGIFVASGGTFQAGTLECPITSKIVITISGNREMGTDPFDNTGFGVRGVVAATGGNVQLFGFKSGPSWTRLSQIARNGSTTITLQEKIGWKVNDTILIASTDHSETFPISLYPDLGKSMPGWTFPDQHEVRTIVRVSGDGRTVTLNSPLNYTHWAEGFEFAEVGLLTRRIVIQGDVGSDATKIGGHLMLRKGNHSISGVEFTRMGQSGVLGRYPVHFHNARFVWGMGLNVQDCSIHDVYQRCVVVHETHGVLVKNNVAYNSYGHCYMLEDGGEHGNEFIRNWGARIIPQYPPLFLSDTQPSVFWISHPNNTFIDNVASGSDIGFWFAMPDMPLRLGATFWKDKTVMNPRKTKLPDGGFKGNVAHSIYHFGIHAAAMEQPDGSVSSGNMGWEPTTGAPFTQKVPLVISDFLIYKVRDRAIWTRVRPSTWSNGVIANTQEGFDPLNGQLVKNITFVGLSNNLGVGSGGKNYTMANPTGQLRPTGGVQHYDVGSAQFIESCTFINYTYAPGYFIGGAYAGQYAFSATPRTTAIGTKLINSNAMHLISGANSLSTNAYLDSGGATGVKGGSWMIGYNPYFHNVPECIHMPQWPGFNCPWFHHGYGYMMISAIAANLITFPEPNDSKVYSNMSLNAGRGRIKAVELGRSIDSQPVNYLKNNNALMTMDLQYTGSAPLGKAWELLFTNGTGHLLRSPGNFSMNPNFKPGDWQIMSIQYPLGTTFNVTTDRGVRDGLRIHTKVNRMEDLSPTTYFFDTNLQRLFLLISSDTSESLRSISTSYSADYALNWVPSFKVDVTASCGDYCTRGKAASVPPALTTLPKVVTHDKYFATLSGSQQYSGKFFAQLYPFSSAGYPIMAYQVYHDIPGADVQIVLMSSNSVYSDDLPVTTLGAGSLVYLTRNQWKLISSGKITVEVRLDGAKLLSGPLLLTDSNKNWIPESNTDNECAPSYGYQYVYNGTMAAGVSTNIYQVNNGRPMNVIRNATEPSPCGGQAVQMSIYGGNIGFSINHNVFKLNNPDYKSLEFFVKYVNNTVNIEFEGTADSITRIRLYQNYAKNYQFSTFEWTLVRIPLSQIGGQLLKKIAFQNGNTGAEMMVANVRYSTEEGALYNYSPSQMTYTGSTVKADDPSVESNELDASTVTDSSFALASSSSVLVVSLLWKMIFAVAIFYF